MLLHHYRVYKCGIYWNQTLKYSWSFARVYKYSIGMTVIIKLWLGMKERGIRIKHMLLHVILAVCWFAAAGATASGPTFGWYNEVHESWHKWEDPVESMESGKGESWFLQSWCISINSSGLFAGISQSILQLCLMKPWFISEIMICLCLSVHARNTAKSLCPLNPMMLTSNWVDNTT